MKTKLMLVLVGLWLVWPAAASAVPFSYPADGNDNPILEASHSSYDGPSTLEDREDDGELPGLGDRHDHLEHHEWSWLVTEHGHDSEDGYHHDYGRDRDHEGDGELHGHHKHKDGDDEDDDEEEDEHHDDDDNKVPEPGSLGLLGLALLSLSAWQTRRS